MRKLLVLGGLVACHPNTAYYVANVYQTNGQLFVERCAIDNGKNSDKPDPDSCRIAPVGELPPGAVPIKGVPDDGSDAAPPAPPAAPAAPPAPPAPPQ